ncbi:MAG: hypothetical protein PF636_12295 [Actinomycetota bacterium]|nr:hypothetical protein [Actinomycetota bacterium]
MTKPRLATMALGGCEGCHVSLIDAHEGLLELLSEVDLVESPFTDGDGTIPPCDVLMVEGAVTNEADERRLLAAREATDILIAVGSCAVMGGIGGLRNLYTARETIAAVYGKDKPGDDGLPALQSSVRAVGQVVDVDISLSGCAPKTEQIVGAIKAAISGAEYELPRRNLCDECHREKSKMLEHSADFLTDSVYSIMELDQIDPNLCFIEQGVICMGPMTREGCGALCTAANVPCRGCSGPSRVDFEQGAKTIDALAAVLPAGAIMYLDDLIGTGYRFSMPVSVIPAAYDHGGDEDV